MAGVCVEGVARWDSLVRRAGVYGAGGRGVELGMGLVEHDCASATHIKVNLCRFYREGEQMQKGTYAVVMK